MLAYLIVGHIVGISLAKNIRLCIFLLLHSCDTPEPRTSHASDYKLHKLHRIEQVSLNC